MRANPNKDLSTAPSSLDKIEQERIALERDLDAIDDAIYKGPKVEITDPDDPYHGEEEYETRLKLRQLFYNKCAYCERIEYKPDVEHYRPKKKVTGAQRNGHGYYWLCYEWSNLLPACRDCNSGNGKWNKFPVSGTRVIAPPLVNGQLDFDQCRANSAHLLGEGPGLFHPEIDQPEVFIQLSWNGKFIPGSEQEFRVKTTIEVCDLNRGNLIHARKKIIDDFIEDLKACFVLFRANQLDASGLEQALLIQLENYKRRSFITQPYSFVCYFIFENYQKFIDDKLNELNTIEKEVVRHCFAEVV